MDAKNIKALIVTLLCFIVFNACKKDEVNTPCCQVPSDTSGAVLIICEGSLGSGNAALGLYLKNKDSAYEDVYKSVNHQALGDVFQSVTKLGSEYFLCVNNSDRIIVLNTANWLRVKVIPIVKPRYMLPVKTGKAYVSSIFSNKIYVLNTATYNVEKQIITPFQNPEGMILADDGAAWVACWDTTCNKVYKIDTDADVITDSIVVGGFAPQELLQDKEGKIWVLSGNVPKGKKSALTRLDIASKTILKSYPFANNEEAIKPVFNNNRDTLYFIEVKYNGGPVDNGVFRMRFDAASLPPSAFVTCGIYQYFWALGVDHQTGNIFIGDPKGFIQKGDIMVYRPDGVMIRQFTTGVGPGRFYFNQ